MKEELKRIKKTKLIELRMPHIDPISLIDNDIDIDIDLNMKFIWGEKTEVQSIEFNLKNKTSNILYKINDVQKCPSGIFYRINLVGNKNNPINSSFVADQTALGQLDMRENHLVRFLFNFIDSGALEEYERFPCKFNSNKPKSKDGAIIIST